MRPSSQVSTLGTWGFISRLWRRTDGGGSYGTMEIDYYAGWAGPIGDTDFGVDVGYYYYQYPGDTVDPTGDYQELNVTGSWKDLSVGVTYSDDFYAENGKYFYYAADYSLSFMEDFSLGFHVGYNDLRTKAFWVITRQATPTGT